MAAALVVLVVASSMALLATVRDRRSPLAWSLWLWVGVAALIVIAALPLVRLNEITALIISTGLVFLTLPVMARRKHLPLARQGNRHRALTRFLILSAATLLMVIIGAVAFRNGIEAAVGTDFDSLDLRQVRSAQNGVGRGGGFAALLAAANPILACLGVYGALRFNRVFLLLLPIAGVAAFQNPARTSSLSLIVITVVFWLYARNALTRDDVATPPRPLPVKRLAAVSVSLVAIFLVVGEQLQKTSVAGTYVTWLPSWAIDPVLYYVGGASALSVATESDSSPIAFGSSIFVIVRTLALLFPALSTPDTIGQFVPIPTPFNVYTGFGQAYFANLQSALGGTAALLALAYVPTIVLYGVTGAAIASSVLYSVYAGVVVILTWRAISDLDKGL